MFQKVIYYPAGCYGSFIHWVMYAALGKVDPTQYPWGRNGNSHSWGQYLIIGNDIVRYFKEQKYLHDIVRFHPSSPSYSLTDAEKIKRFGVNNTNVSDDLLFLSDNGAKTLAIYPTVDSALWVCHNTFKKIILTTDQVDFLMNLQPDTVKEDYQSLLIHDPEQRIRYFMKDPEFKLPRSDLRRRIALRSIGGMSVFDHHILDFRSIKNTERFVSNIKTNSRSTISNEMSIYGNVKFIPVSGLKYNFAKTVNECFDFFEVKNNSVDLTELEYQWRLLQQDINKDKICNDIVNAVVNNFDYDWSNEKIELLDEAYIEILLMFNGYTIPTGNDFLPTNTQDLKKILIKRKTQ